MKGIIIASHGKLASGMLDTIKMFSGEPEQMESLCLLPGQEISEYVTQMNQAVERVNTGEGVVIFCDLLFGSPCNCSAQFLKDLELSKEVTIITGFNLPMILEYVGSRDANRDVDDIMKTGKSGIVDFKQLYESRK
ncbi:PTS mannose transporter subunit IIA [Erysipelotrichaceae bacterium MTC7]|nr:PTS mannose transporter subunit IIA [Erysipelotrichaceae bacterium MTC7]